jgi:rhodanese-related sulfurtransferase
MRFLLLALLLAAFACQNQPSSGTVGAETSDSTKTSRYIYTFTDTILVSLAAKDYYAVIKSKPNLPILDLRSEDSFKRGHIWRAVSFDASAPDFAARLNGFGKEQEYAVYCSDGFLSLKVAEDMKKQGFYRIYHLQKGLVDWGDSGQALQLK